MTDMMELKSANEALAVAFEHYRATNDERLTKMEGGKAVDGLVDAKLARLDTEINRLQGLITGFKTAAARPATPLTSLAGSNQWASEQTEGRAAFVKYVTRGVDDSDSLHSLGGTKGFAVGNDPEGGFLVPGEVGERVLARQYDTTPLRQLANVLTISSDAIELLRDSSDAAAEWVGETDSRAETDAGGFGRIRITAHELHAQPQATQKLLDDATVNVEEFIINKIAERFARRENAAFVNGTGVNQPRGIASYATAATADDSRAWGTFEHVKTGANGAFHSSNPADVLISLMYKMKSGYLNGASWLMPRAVADDIRKFKETTTGNYLWQPGLAAGAPATLLGFPVYMAEDMPAKTTGSLSVAFGNFREGYTIVDRMGLRIFRDPYTAAPFVKFRCSKRVGGDVTNFDAIKFIQFSA